MQQPTTTPPGLRATSDEERVPTGLPGLDRILCGGLIPDRVYLLLGAPGCGKTTAGLQFLLEGERHGEPGLLVSHSETREEIEAVARSHGWDLGRLHLHEWRGDGDQEREGYTIFHAAELELGDSMRRLLEQVEEVRPQRVVIDSIVGLRLLAPDDFFYTRQIRMLRSFFVGRKCTVLLVDESADSGAETIVHGVLRLENVAQEFGPERRRLRVSKMRGTDYAGGYHDFVIRRGGLDVYPRLVAADHGRPFDGGSASSGVEGLDDLLGGGLPRGTSTLVLGPAGVGKSTLVGHCAVRAAARGELAVVLLFDEVERTWVERLRGLDVDPRPHLESGALQLTRLDPAEVTPGWLANHLRSAVGRGARLVGLDSLNGYLQAMAEERHVAMHLRELITYLNTEGVTTLATLSQHGMLGPQMALPVDVSFLADNVLMLRYFEAAGEVRQAISVVKKRTGRHERTIRELRFDPHGVRVGATLREFFGILTGTPTYRGTHESLLEARAEVGGRE